MLGRSRTKPSMTKPAAPRCLALVEIRSPSTAFMRRAAGVDDDHVARLDHVQRLVDHQVVAGEHLHRARRAADAVVLAGQAVDPRVDRVEAVEQVGDVRRRERAKRAHQLRDGRGKFTLHAETRAGVQVSGSGFVGHGFSPQIFRRAVVLQPVCELVIDAGGVGGRPVPVAVDAPLVPVRGRIRSCSRRTASITARRHARRRGPSPPARDISVVAAGRVARVGRQHPLDDRATPG